MRIYFRPLCAYLCMLGLFALSLDMPGLMVNAASHAAAHPAHALKAASCQAGWVYDNIVVLDYPFIQLASYQNANDTGESETSTFTEASTGTFATVTSRGLLVSTNLVVASVTRTLGKAVVRAITITSGNTVTFPVPSHKVAHADYGVFEVEVQGHYYYRDQFCNIPFLLDGGLVTSWCPWYAGWHTWLSGPETKKTSGQSATPGQSTAPGKSAPSKSAAAGKAGGL